jgi:putative ABC transport system permease protein
MESLWQDVRYSLRLLLKTPAFLVVAVIALALGIGANTAIFSVVNGVLLKPLPYHDAEHLVRVSERMAGGGLEGVPAIDYLAWKEHGQYFDDIAAYGGNDYNLIGEGDPRRVAGSRVTANMFGLLGVNPIHGRVFSGEEDRPGAGGVVLLSYGLWQQQFGGDVGAVGRVIRLDERSYEIIGILPRSFRLPQPSDIVIPFALDAEKERAGERGSLLSVIGRLRAGVSTSLAREDFAAIIASMDEYTRTKLRPPNMVVSIVQLHEYIAGDVSRPLWVLFGAVAFVLLIACANVANLFLARASGRQKEIAIRAALGARRLRLIRQLVVESLLLAVMAGALGVLIALWGVDLLLSHIPPDVADFARETGKIAVDGSVLGFTLAVSILTGVLFGIVPALAVSKPDLNQSLKEGSRGGVIKGWRGLRGALVISEVALAVVLLAGAGLTMRSFLKLQSVDPGFRTERLLTMEIILPRSKYPKEENRAAFFKEVIERVNQLEGIESASATSNLPLSGSYSMMGFVSVEGKPPVDPAKDNPIPLGVVSSGYFETLGIPLKAGRFFTEEDDRANAPPVAILNEAAARRFFPGEQPVGKRIKTASRDWRTVVGVVGDVYLVQLGRDARPEIYMPYLRQPVSGMKIVARTRIEPEQMISALRAEVQAVDKDQPIAQVKTMSGRISESIAPERFYLLLFGAFAALALLLAAIGIYGVMSYSVAQRTREIGIRQALGAAPRHVLGLIVRQAIGLSLIGIAIGLGAAALLTRLMTSLLYEISPGDPTTFAIIPVILLGVALAACFIPARRAARVDPMVALRHE